MDTELNKGEYASMNVEYNTNIFARRDIFCFKSDPGDGIRS
jgi:hypothetical protein